MRYLPHTPQDRADMLARIGVGGIDDLFADIPAAKRLTAAARPAEAAERA